MARDPDTVDRLLNEMIESELRSRDPGRHEYLVRKDMLSGHINIMKERIVRAVFERFFKL